MRKSAVAVLAALGVCLWLNAQERERVDLSAAHKIRSEAFGRNSKVMDTAFWLTDRYGPRLTGSPQIKEAADWAVKKLTEWGLVNAKIEPWGGGGTFGRGWECTRLVAMIKSPQFQPLIAYAQPWSPGTNGDVTGEAVLATITNAEEMNQWKGKLKGKIVLTSPERDLAPPTAPLFVRLTDAELADAATAPDPTSGNPSSLPLGFIRNPAPAAPAAGRGAGGRGGAGGGRGGQQNFRSELNKFLKGEGVVAVVSAGSQEGGTVAVQSAGSPNPSQEPPPPSVVVAAEHYNRIARLLQHNIPVTLELDVQTRFTDPADSFNIAAEIPGSDPNAGLVMLGGHFDSWASATGATDNAAGSAVAMEAVRILKSLNTPLRRTVRIALWTGEEQGILGSRAYVKEHFADPADMKPKPEHARLSAYFNLDNGSGKVRGVYMQDNDQLRPIFEAWLEPFRDLGVNTLTIRNTGSTDHVSFDAVGLPAFQFIQDPLDYGSRTHHTNMDVYDELRPNDMEQASAVMAWFVYNTANRGEQLPRNPMPKPGAGRGR
ncbi:MAG TPA: M20/M25/M40 family metallo-hydrolase [Candidatus Limnocylindrales bacterium]|nr:M20/M25/M40 family metallo-hydrolase [Candidatus Limnocylindrales bacterium]